MHTGFSGSQQSVTSPRGLGGMNCVCLSTGPGTESLSPTQLPRCFEAQHGLMQRQVTAKFGACSGNHIGVQVVMTAAMRVATWTTSSTLVSQLLLVSSGCHYPPHTHVQKICLLLHDQLLLWVARLSFTVVCNDAHQLPYVRCQFRSSGCKESNHICPGAQSPQCAALFNPFLLWICCIHQVVVLQAAQANCRYDDGSLLASKHLGMSVLGCCSYAQVDVSSPRDAYISK